MSLIRLDMTVSMDGFVAGPQDDADEPIGVGGFRLSNWLDRRHDPDANGRVFNEVMATRTVIAGRRTYENAGRWNGDHHDGVRVCCVARAAPGCGD